MNLKMIAASVALALGTSAAVAAIEPTPTVMLKLTESGSGALSTSFVSPVTGFFTDTFLIDPSTFVGTVSVSLVPVSGPVHFFSALLNGEGFSYLPEEHLTTSTFAFSSSVGADTPFGLTVFGFAGGLGEDEDVESSGSSGSYSGTITASGVSAIPEPETYALMLAGLAALGTVARRSRRGEAADALAHEPSLTPQRSTS